MRDLKEFLTERQIYIYQEHFTRSSSDIAKELGITANRICDITRCVERKIRKEKRLEQLQLCNQGEVTITFQVKELYVIERAFIEYMSILLKKHVIPRDENDYWADPDYNAGKEIIKKIQEALQ